MKKNSLLFSVLFSTLLAVLSFTFLPKVLASGSIYFVATTGSDTNTGSESAPFKTISKAVSLVTAGDTIMVRGGTYTEKISIAKNGTSESPIILQSAPGEAVILDLAKSAGPNLIITGSYIVVDGFEIQNSSGVCVSLQNQFNTLQNSVVHDCHDHGIMIEGQHHTVANNTVYHATDVNSGFNTGWGSGIKVKVGGDYSTIRGNTVYHNYGEGIAVTRGTNAVVTQNTVYDNFGVNIYIDNSHDVLVERNFSYCNANSGFERDGHTAAGIALGEEYYEGWGAQLARVQIRNNIVYKCNRGVITYGSDVPFGGLDTISIVNNTFWDVSNTALSINTNLTPTKSRDIFIANNIVYQASGKMVFADDLTGLTFKNNNWSVKPATYAQHSSDVIGSPAFNSSPSYDPFSFRLSALSPVIDKGALVSEVTDDYENKLRVTAVSPGVDMGAFEYESGVVATPLPTPSPSSPPMPTLHPTPIPDTAPTITITAPETGSTIFGRNLNVSGFATDDQTVSKIELLVDGKILSTKTTAASLVQYTFSVNTRKWTKGSHRLTVKAYDSLSQSGLAEITVSK